MKSTAGTRQLRHPCLVSSHYHSASSSTRVVSGSFLGECAGETVCVDLRGECAGECDDFHGECIGDLRGECAEEACDDLHGECIGDVCDDFRGECAGEDVTGEGYSS